MFLPEERRQRILADIDHSGAGLVGKLSQKYGVSEMTIRRDLDALEELGYVKRTHGGAIRSVVPEPELTIVGRDKRLKLNTAQKVRIARYAAREYVAEGDVVLLEGGTTVATMVAYLAHVEELTLVTNGLATMV
ncbi:MAG: DeoR/GlpR family DNA-binding transcription regulator, partial [Candidatus Binatia bacterium]